MAFDMRNATGPLVVLFAAVALFTSRSRGCNAFAFPAPPPSWTHAIKHLISPLLRVTPLKEMANIQIPGPSHAEILAYEAMPSEYDQKNCNPLPSIILIHKFFGLNPSIVEKDLALFSALNCREIAPNTFQGEVTNFVTRAIWLALTTPQDRVNEDLDAVCAYIAKEKESVGFDHGNLAVMGFSYRGGKAIRYTSQRRRDAAMVVFYGSPLTDVDEMRRLRVPVCGAFGSKDAQFPRASIDGFWSSLDEVGVENNVRVYDGVGHMFWSDIEQVKRGHQPQSAAYEQCTSFL